MKNKKGKSLLGLALLIAAIGLFGYFGYSTMGAIKLGLDLAGGVSITYQAKEANPSAEDMSDTIYKLRMRVENYSSEAEVYQEGVNRINVDIPGVSDANAILQDLGQPGSLVFMDSEGNQILEGRQVTSAKGGIIDQNGVKEYVVQLAFDEEGTKAFADATTNGVGKPIYIIYDGRIISYPMVREPITGGQCRIDGMADLKEAEELAANIRIGSLSLELEELRSNVVGAKLGQEAISTSLKAGAIGFAIVVVFMIAVYLIPGVAASLALCLYVGLILVLLKAFEITLTLPGVAGIVLSIGMAVDANVIIFTRIKEEIGVGKTVKSAIKTGFAKALSAIIDGNVTTLIAAAVLFWRGSGTVKGFASTLALGIVLSMVTALFITKFALNCLYEAGFEDVKFYGVRKDIAARPFLKPRKAFFGVSLLLIVAGFAAMGVNRASTGAILNYGMEFRGGTSTNVTFNEDLSLERISSEVVPVDTALADKFGVDPELITADSISGAISAEMKRDAIVAVTIATICMLIYIWFRFSNITFAASAVLALVHDVLVVLTFYAALKWSISSTFIACMLTIVGYSINATIVIFDRIRENMKLKKYNQTIEDVVNLSITQTFTRSINTSLTTFIMVFVLFVMGVSSIREFALPMMVGIVCGTYSSVFLTGAMWYVFSQKKEKKNTDGV